jgi:serine/threonine protein kinase
MQVRISPMSELIPGYRLLEPLGRGGFGEVWKCEAPGGLLKAIKIVHGSFQQNAVGDEEVVQKELRSLDCVKAVRHPFILSLDRYDVIFGHLLIVMELADCNLSNRLEECKKQGQQGIPRDELLHYLAEAAEALDLMNHRYDLQHSDVKPQNLFLVHNHVKVADFGLVKDLEGTQTAAGTGISPLYAAPETFQGWVSRQSDQYSLAVVYQELLTGQRPFDGTNARQLLMQHVQMPPNLEPVPEDDRPALCRALAKEPAERFPSCQAFVETLRGNSPSGDRNGDTRAVSDGGRPTAKMKVVKKTVAVRPHSPTKSGIDLEREGSLGKPGLVIAVRCPSCGFTGQVPASFQGQRVRCRVCRKAFPVAGFADPDAAAPTGGETDTEAQATVPEVEAPTAAFLEVECPVCGNIGPVPETYRDRRLKCRQCGCVHREGVSSAQ